MKITRKRLKPTRIDRRGGFTLIELIMVIAIIAALAALIFPAINSVRSNVKVAEVRQEISGLESAIADFELKFGQAPPSQITLHEEGGTWSAQSRGIIRSLWPKFDFTQDRDFNGDSTSDATFNLKGDQCLVFFLGGFWNSTSGFRGFSPIPTNPFASANSVPSSPVGPFFDFDISRVVDVNGGVGGASYSAPLEFFPVYFDPIPDQQKPYIYASSYDGTGYNGGDVITAASGTSFSGYVNSGNTPWKSKTFQIISPGFDGDYGNGGLYDPESNPPVNSPADKDNITNFASGELD